MVGEQGAVRPLRRVTEHVVAMRISVGCAVLGLCQKDC